MSCNGTLTDQEIIDLLFIIAPQFVTTDPVKLAQYATLIEALRCMINVRLLGCCAALAFANLLAHYLSLQLNPALGLSTSLTEGQLSIGLASTVSTGSFYFSTPYGQAYWQLVSKFKVGAFVTNAGRFGIGSFGYGPSCCGGY